MAQRRLLSLIKTFTTIVGGNQDDEAVEKRIEALKQQIEQEENLNVCEKYSRKNNTT